MNMDAIKAEYQSDLVLVEDAKQLSEFWAKYFGKAERFRASWAASKKCQRKKRKLTVRL